VSGMTRLAYVVLWSALLAQALLFAPDPRPDQAAWLVDLLTGDWGREEPLVVGTFQLMGVWPVALAAILAPRLRSRPVPLWPFVLASFALGAFALLPGLVLVGSLGSGERAPLGPSMSGWQRLLRHPALLGALALVAAGFGVWMALKGDGLWWWRAFQREQFVHLMTLDFVALWLTSILAAKEEGGPWWLCVAPLFGALAFAWRRGVAETARTVA
jgi:hypothetical protein